MYFEIFILVASFDMTLVCWELQTSSKTASPFVFKQTNLLHFNGIILCLKVATVYVLVAVFILYTLLYVRIAPRGEALCGVCRS